MKTCLQLSCCVIVVHSLIVGTASSEQLVLDDGGVHTLDRRVVNPDETPGVVVTNATTLNVVDGAFVRGIELDNSMLNANGGNILSPEFDEVDPAVVATGTSSVDLQGTDVSGRALLRGRSEIELESGTLWSDRWAIQLYDDSSGTMTGGDALACRGDPRLFRDADAIAVLDLASFSLSGGNISCGGLSATGIRVQSRLLMTGGAIFVTEIENGVPVGIESSGMGYADILGGEINLSIPAPSNVVPRHLVPRDDSTIRVYGSDFNYPLGAISDPEGTLTGVLANGDPIEWNFLRDGPGASIILVPEPAGVSVLLSGLVCWPFRRKRSSLKEMT